MNWQDVYELWIEYGAWRTDETWVILDRNTAKRVEIIGYRSKVEAEYAAKQLFNRIVDESEKIILG